MVLLKRRALYDGGNVFQYSKLDQMENAAITWAGNQFETGALTSIFDYNPTTFIGDNNGTGGAQRPYILFDFGKKIKFKTIMGYIGISGTGTEAKLQGSNDNAAWTDLDSLTGAPAYSTLKFGNMQAANVTYRYIRVSRTAGGGTYVFNVYTMKGVSDEL